MRPLDVFVPKDTEVVQPLYELLQATIEANADHKPGDLSVVFTQATLVNSGEMLLRSLVIPPEVGNEIAKLIKSFMSVTPLTPAINAAYNERVFEFEVAEWQLPNPPSSPIDPAAVALLDSYRYIFFPEKGFRP